MLTIVIVLLAPISILFAQTADLPPVAKPDPMPAAARQTMEKYDRSVAEAKKVYDAAVARAADAARKELLRLQEQETKAGRLESALAIKTQVEKLPSEDPGLGALLPRGYADLLAKVEGGHLTETEWNALPGVKINAAADSTTDTKIVVHRNEVWLVVPHPTDKWRTSTTIDPFTYLGIKNPKHTTYPEWCLIIPDFMRLQVIAGDVTLKGYLVEDQEGKLTARCNDHVQNDNLGEIRAKIIKVR